MWGCRRRKRDDVQFLGHGFETLESLEHHERQISQVQFADHLFIVFGDVGVLLQILDRHATQSPSVMLQNRRYRARTSNFCFRPFSSLNRAIFASRRAAASRVLAVEKLALSSL